MARLNLATAGEIEGDDDVAVAYREAVAMAVKGDFDAAVAALIALLAVQRDWQDDRIRKTLVDIFSVLGDDARLKVWRTKMARVLN